MGEQNGQRVVAVTGATGFVGRHLVRELLDRGHAVRALVRSDAKARSVLPVEAIQSGRITLVEGDVLAEGVCGRLVGGADACCHLIGIIREGSGGQTFERMHVRATERVVGACERARGDGSMRYIHMSALGVGPDGPAAYQKTKFRAERVVGMSRTAWTIFRPGMIHGPDGEFMQMAKAWCQGRAVPRVFIPYFAKCRLDDSLYVPTPRFGAPAMAPVRVEDVAWAFAEALDRPATAGEIYPLVGAETLGMDEMLRELRDALPVSRRSMPVVGVPGRAAAVQARVMSAVGAGSWLPFDEGMALMGSSDSTAPLDKTRADLGFEPGGYRDAVRVYAERM